MEKIKFSNREAQVIKLLMEGKSNKQIAAILQISEGTVEFHLTRIYTKLKVSSRMEAFIRLRELGETLDFSRGKTLWEILGEMGKRHGKTPVEMELGNDYAVNENLTPGQDVDMVRKKLTRPRNLVIPLISGFVIVLIVSVAAYLFFGRPRIWQYQREAEYPDASTVGQTIGRSNASAGFVHGQFGGTSADPWPAKAGGVVYKNISTPKVDQLYLKLRYSKNSPPSVPILIYLDDEKAARASVYPADQKDWNRFAWTNSIYLGSMESGVHTITFSTIGQQYGVADLDKFILSTGAP
jgi:DNA-binding CsgD family transcriptional regulator